MMNISNNENARGAAWSAPVAGEATDLVTRLRQSVVQVQTRTGSGSGVIWTADGRIVTNAHVVGTGRGAVSVELADGRQVKARVLALDAGLDLALLQIEAYDLTPIPIGDSTRLRVGELIIAVGNPRGVVGTATLGIVSATSDAMWMGETGRTRGEILQADVRLAPGNSGGPLANCAGEVVGIASMIVSPGIAIAIPIQVAARFVAAHTTGQQRAA